GLAAIGRAVAELVYFHSLLPQAAILSSVVDSALWGVILAIVFGEATEAMVRQRRTSDALQAYTRDVLTLADPHAVLRRVVAATAEIVSEAIGVAVWIRVGDRAVCLAGAGILSPLRTADVPLAELEDPKLQRGLMLSALGVSAPLVASGDRQGTLIVTCRRRWFRRTVPRRVRVVVRAIADAAALP